MPQYLCKTNNKPTTIVCANNKKLGLVKKGRMTNAAFLIRIFFYIYILSQITFYI